jgi:hypothetical protein
MERNKRNTKTNSTPAIVNVEKNLSFGEVIDRAKMLGYELNVYSHYGFFVIVDLNRHCRTREVIVKRTNINHTLKTIFV